MDELNHMETGILYKGNEVIGEVSNPDTPPVYFASAYAVKDTKDYDFANKGGKYFYNRTANPNRDCLGRLISYLEGGEETIVCSSGMAAISTVLLGLLKKGDHVLFNTAIYGETIELANGKLKDWGIEISYADFTKPEEVEKEVRPNTVMLYTEVIANPLTLVVDLDKISAIAKKNSALLVVDSTFTTPVVMRPIEHGADIVIHSLTKYFGGHSDITGGSVTAGREIIKKLMGGYWLLGCCMDPYSAWLTARSAQTLKMRVSAQNYNAVKLAKALQEHPKVRAVYHPSLSDHPQHELADKLFTEGMYGAMISFRVEDDINKVDDFMHRLKLVQYLGTLGGIRTSITHPSTAFQNEFSAEELLEMGLYPGLIRISTGAENADDLIRDFYQALEAF